MASPPPTADDDGETRRDFLALTAGAMGGVGACITAWPLIQSMNPAADVLALSTTEVDLSGLKEGQSMNAVWQGKPVFIRYRTQKEIDEARAAPMSDLKDPQTDEDRVKQSVFDGKEMPQYLIMVGICTHLGCIPLGQKPTDPHGNYDGWFCPCHGSQYDASGRIRQGPAPKNLSIPPYSFTSATAVVIGKAAEKTTSNFLFRISQGSIMAAGKRVPFKNPVIDWIDERLPVFTMMQKEYGNFPTPKNFNYLWNFGAIATFMLVTMIATGVFLAMFYTPEKNHAFNSVERIMRDVNWGWLIRYIHMNGASMFFMAVFVHMFRGLYYGSYKKPRELLWMIGVVILLLMMATAFMGYVLPWGQMSFWGATVITNLFSAIPLVGDKIVTWLWGGFAVDNPTLNRFYALHFLLPFVIFGVVFLHIAALHVPGSNNPLGIDVKSSKDTVPFHPYYTAKDGFGLLVFLIFYMLIVFYAPNALGDPDNYIPANPMATPEHIVPEWYFLPFYAILRSFTIDIHIPFTHIVFISSKLGGVILMFGAVLLLFVLPWLDWSPVRSATFRPWFRRFFWIFLVACVALGWVGSQKPEGFPVIIGQIATAYYFTFFLVILPLLPLFEKTLPLPKSIAEAVLKKSQGA